MSRGSFDEMLVSSYDYELPSDLIASSPAVPKDSARLLIYDRSRDKITHTIFRDILSHIPDDSAIILNDTKVIKARLFGNKQSGAKMELLINSPMPNDRFLVYIKGRVKKDTTLEFDLGLSAVVNELNSDGTRVATFYKGDKILDFKSLNEILDQIGHIPLPPYIKRDDNIQDSIDYQTLFAKNIGAVAAPTASLHFTPKLLESLKKKFDTKFITLHVGAGTFKPVEVDDIKNHKMHSEFYNIPKNTQELIDSNKKILAVGTTVTRTIEYYARKRSTNGRSNLFLHPQNPPKRVDFLLTNFHLPKSTLIMLVSSFIGVNKTLEIYNEAIKKGYRFYSYGDAMLII